MPPPKKKKKNLKKKVHPRSIANLKGQPKPARETPEADPPIDELAANDEETVPTDVEFDSTRARSEESGGDFETLVKEDDVRGGENLVKDGRYAITQNAAIEGKECFHLGDNRDDPKDSDEDYLTGAERKAKRRKETEKKDRPSRYNTGCDVSQKAPRTQRMPKWKARRNHQSTLDGFLTVRRKSRLLSSGIGKTQSDDEVY